MPNAVSSNQFLPLSGGVLSGRLGVGGATPTATKKLIVGINSNDGIAVQNSNENSYSVLTLESAGKLDAGKVYYQGPTQGYLGNNDSVVFGSFNNTTRFRLITDATNRFAVETDGRIVESALNTAINDALLWNGSLSARLDQAANKLIFRVKYSDGTLKTGEVNLL